MAKPRQIVMRMVLQEGDEGFDEVAELTTHRARRLLHRELFGLGLQTRKALNASIQVAPQLMPPPAMDQAPHEKAGVSEAFEEGQLTKAKTSPSPKAFIKMEF